ncbi:Rieske [2Fe-2S] domain-containing protein [Parasphingorhabdus marina DSM 22363]|uniref:Rieske [2Fe-2S] domain-containing protein n=2 Tax=Parasphingorhabdus marina TaxID=394732 RepID=A0A1N6D401_9SPHN|nr:Rieske [2Fe-2S] domain-containing protein [Parasphingorhabdus marina DSM 22363]
MPVRSTEAPRPTVAEMLAADNRAVPDVLLNKGEAEVTLKPIPKERYYSAEFASKEFDGVWGKAWQMACRVEDIPEKGDYLVYQIGDTSLLIVRVSEDSVKALHNVCLHRGRLLRDEDGKARDFKCPFHGFAWHIDGRCKFIPNEWDFGHIDKDAFGLPEARVELWEGFVFVNLNADAEPLEDFLENVPEAYRTRGWSLGARTKTVHVQKINRCNWKVALEAFIESFHVTETHRGAAPYLGDANTQYDVWENSKHTRMISPRGLHSPNIRPISDVEVFRAAVRGVAADEIEVPDGEFEPRAAIGQLRRQGLVESGVEVAEQATDSELIDTIHYHIFPNLVCWAGWGSYLVYRFRPYKKDPEMSVMDIMFLDPAAEPSGRLEPQIIGPDASHHEAPQLGGYCDVFDEDSGNLESLQHGLRAMTTAGPVTASYQEARIRHFHEILGQYIKDD